ILIHSLRHPHQCVDAHYIRRAEGRRLWSSNDWSRQCFDLIDCKTKLVSQTKYCHDAIDPNSVCNECRSILRQHRGLTKMKISIVHQKTHHSRICLGSWNDLQQPEISWWIEKMRTTEILLEVITPPFTKHMYGNSRSIRSDECARLPEFLHAFVKRFLYVQSLHNHFYDPIRIRDVLQIIIEIARLHKFRHILIVYRRWIALYRRLQRIIHQLISFRRLLRPLRCNIK